MLEQRCITAQYATSTSTRTSHAGRSLAHASGDLRVNWNSSPGHPETLLNPLPSHNTNLDEDEASSTTLLATSADGRRGEVQCSDSWQPARNHAPRVNRGAIASSSSARPPPTLQVL